MFFRISHPGSVESLEGWKVKVIQGILRPAIHHQLVVPPIHSQDHMANQGLIHLDSPVNILSRVDTHSQLGTHSQGSTHSQDNTLLHSSQQVSAVFSYALISVPCISRLYIILRL